MLLAHNFVDDQVSTQLSAQQIYFPEKGSDALNDPAVKPYLSQYAGQQLTSGAQAEAFADHYIAVHLDEMSGGKTYAELSATWRANPDDKELAGLVETVFKGESLRGMLLNAYAFGQMGAIAFYGALVSFGGAILMLALSLLGLAHLRRVPAEAEVKLGAAPQARHRLTEASTRARAAGSGPSSARRAAPHRQDRSERGRRVRWPCYG